MNVIHCLARRSAALCFSSIILIHATGAFAAAPDTIKVDTANRRVEIPGKVAPQDVYEQLKGVIEYVATCDGGKKYESLFVLQPRAELIFEATEKIGLVRGKPAYDDDSGAHYLPIGQPVRLLVRWEAGGEAKEHRVEDFVTNEQKTETMPHCEWTYIGSEMVDDPAGDKKVPQVAISQNVISLHHQDQWVLIQNPLESATDQSQHHTNKDLLPPAGTSITLVIEAPKPPEGLERIHVYLTGRVQGVGFRNFTQRAARQLDVKGWVKNLEDGRVELVAEGDKAVLEKFMESVRRGPRPAKVDKVEVNQEPPTNMFRDFQIEY